MSGDKASQLRAAAALQPTPGCPGPPALNRDDAAAVQPIAEPPAVEPACRAARRRAARVPYRAIAALAAAGLADSAYLTAVKVLSLTPACPLSGGGTGASCGDILTSEYSTLFGVVPLAAVGMLAYGGMAALALAGAAAASGSSAASAPASAAAAAQAAAASGEAPAAAEGESAAAGAGAAAAAPAAERSAAQAAEEAPYRRAVLAGGLAMATCSSCLLYIMLTKFGGALCPWCLASAALSFGIAALAASGLRPRELSEAAAPGAGAVATTLLLLSLGLGTPNLSFASGGYDLDYSLPEVTSASGPDAVSLAERLAAAGARMYGAFWCSHCYDQKQAFGAEAMAAFPYDTKMAAVCEAAPGGLQGFPTWVIGGEQLVGEQTFEQLEAALAKAEAAAPATAAS
ncbi:hypothetical protein CHLNCDRAFT_50574 [Chlorella variabilis]|uniref:Vitamin K epoxide reductase domain-containing protein n=1 Tax=Chlorella variabilis TaxID=554065 RepID=E1Z7H6_CHLVA|nr:hypothetical protein CHLNCDRAFT_50574 [Chlorella variabilis]EFN57922.1 hypothetical protein CHLNCDRAFT_50574 [Chlorella variabilis]|eukprot:XP_005850024.1 hypothetical protein CHLNCDRAFT_50574 [Chlorella variabilis]